MSVSEGWESPNLGILELVYIHNQTSMTFQNNKLVLKVVLEIVHRVYLPRACLSSSYWSSPDTSLHVADEYHKSVSLVEFECTTWWHNQAQHSAWPTHDQHCCKSPHPTHLFWILSRDGIAWIFSWLLPASTRHLCSILPGVWPAWIIWSIKPALRSDQSVVFNVLKFYLQKQRLA